MLQNAYLLAKIGADTAENERNFAEILLKFGNYPTGPWTFRGAGASGQGGRSTSQGPTIRCAPWQPSGPSRRRRLTCAYRRDAAKMHFSKMHFSKILQIFGGLVLFCTDAKFCKKIFVGKLLTRSTGVTCFSTAQTSIFQQTFVKRFLIFWQNVANFVMFE